MAIEPMHAANKTVVAASRINVLFMDRPSLPSGVSVYGDASPIGLTIGAHSLSAGILQCERLTITRGICGVDPLTLERDHGVPSRPQPTLELEKVPFHSIDLARDCE